MDITATLKNTRRVGGRLVGEIYGDTRKRFLDGDVISTSTVMKEHPGNVFMTLYSIYKVEFAKGES